MKSSKVKAVKRKWKLVSKDQAKALHRAGAFVLWKTWEFRETKSPGNWGACTDYSSFTNVDGFRDFFKVEVE